MNIDVARIEEQHEHASARILCGLPHFARGSGIATGVWGRGPRMAREMILRRREVLVLDAIEDLVGSLRALREERKAVITVSDGWLLSHGRAPHPW